MKVKFVKTGKTVTVDDSYGVRLIEQGKAVPAGKESAADAPEEPQEPEPAPAKNGKNRKGE